MESLEDRNSVLQSGIFGAFRSNISSKKQSRRCSPGKESQHIEQLTRDNALKKNKANFPKRLDTAKYISKYVEKKPPVPKAPKKAQKLSLRNENSYSQKLLGKLSNSQQKGYFELKDTPEEEQFEEDELNEEDPVEIEGEGIPNFQTPAKEEEKLELD